MPNLAVDAKLRQPANLTKEARLPLQSKGPSLSLHMNTLGDTLAYGTGFLQSHQQVIQKSQADDYMITQLLGRSGMPSSPNSIPGGSGPMISAGGEPKLCICSRSKFSPRV